MDGLTNAILMLLLTSHIALWKEVISVKQELKDIKMYVLKINGG